MILSKSILQIALLGSFLFTSNIWGTDLETAKQSAKAEHKFIMLNFSGSDWCGPCIRMHEDIFEGPAFSEYSKDYLVLVNADFPRLKKNELPKEQQKKNDQLADQYNKDGIFPLTLLLDANGKVLQRWEGLPHSTSAEFTNQVKSVVDANR
jgi:thioredoxin-related protein